MKTVRITWYRKEDRMVVEALEPMDEALLHQIIEHVGVWGTSKSALFLNHNVEWVVE